MNNLLLILGMASMMNLVHATPFYHQFLAKNHIDRKPFNCVMCSTFWYTLIPCLITNPFSAIFIASITAIIAELINIQIHKI